MVFVLGKISEIVTSVASQGLIFCRRSPAHAQTMYFLLTVAIATLSLSCNESLPTHVNPNDLFRGETSVFFYAPKNSLAGSPQLWVYLVIKNDFDEALQDTSALLGSIDISLDRDPHYHKTASLDLSNLLTTDAFDPKTRLLTIGSGDTLALLYRWNFVDDNGIYLPDDVFHLQKDSQCPTRVFASPESFTVKGSLRLYKSTAPINNPELHYVLSYFIGFC